MEDSRSVVRFPEPSSPEGSPVYSFNEIYADTPPQRVWDHLIAADDWFRFYENCTKMKIDGGGPLALGTTFHWNTFGVRVHTTIEEFEHPHRLAWSGRAFGTAAFHGWVLEPNGSGTRIVTEETQRGLVASVGRLYLRRALHKHHQRWLEGLARVAAEYPPEPQRTGIGGAGASKRGYAPPN